MGEISQNLAGIRERIRGASESCKRDPAGIRLIAVSKTVSFGMVKEAHAAGQRAFGENYVQELVKKADILANLDIDWHFIGHLQRNKVKYVIPIVKSIHSLDSIRLAEEIEKRAPQPLNCLIEVNLAGEGTKTGIDPAGLPGLIQAVKGMSKINLTGLMTIPPYDADPENSRPYFIKLRELMNKINDEKLYARPLAELSMGMTFDLEIAIEEGSTFVRVGTGIFGARG